MALGLANVGSAIGQPELSRRPPRVDDRFEREEFRAFVFSPDGQSLALVRRRPANSQITNGLQAPDVRDDIWIQDAPGSPARNLTDGATDASGWWAPTWSPNGRRLAFLSSRGGNVTLWVWDRGATRPRQVSKDGVAFARKDRFAWVDDRRIVAVALPEGERSAPVGQGGYEVGLGAELATAAWAKAARGEVTARAIHSLRVSLPRYRLALLDVTTGTSRTIADTEGDWPFPYAWWASPNGEVIAVRRPAPSALSLMPRHTVGYPASIDLVSIDGNRLVFDRPLPANVVTSTISWSPDGKKIAFFALGDAFVHPELLYGEGVRDIVYPSVSSKEYPGRLWQVDLARRVVEQVDTGDIDLGLRATPPPFRFTANGEFLFRTPRLMSGARPIASAPLEWLVLGDHGRTRPLTSGSTPLPSDLESIQGGSAFLGLAKGDLWSVDVAQGTTTNLTARLATQVRAFQAQESPAGDVRILLTASDEPTTEAERLAERLWKSSARDRIAFGTQYLLDVKSGETTRITRPASDATVTAFSAASRSLVFSSSTRDGLFAWRSDGTAAAVPLVVANTLLRRIVEFENRLIEYTSLNGEKLTARITLPLGYQPGRRYPLVVDSDTSSSPSTSPTDFLLHELSDPVLDDGAIFAAAGYLYVWPTMPIDGMDNVGRTNLLSYTDGILPAVDKAIELGLADPDRLFLYGTSSMGNAVMGLVTQTARFKAAVAGYGWADQTVYGLERDFVTRYKENAFDRLLIEPAYSTSRLPFWRDGDQRRRNSPLTYVDRVQTPILIVNGEMDSIAPTSAEMFFAALVQQRKPAQFVHYWGEGHFVKSPANERDFWQRVFAWFDEYGDIARDATGSPIFENGRVKSRGGATPLTPTDFARFGPAAHVGRPGSTSEPQP